MDIKTDRLVIRKFKCEDWQDVYEYTSNPHVMKYIPEGVFTEEDAKKFVNENMGENAEKFSVVLKEENIVIGHIAFLSILVSIVMKLGGYLIRSIIIKGMPQKLHKLY